MWDPINYIKRREEAEKDLVVKKEISELRERLIPVRKQLEYLAMMRCLPMEIAKQKIHWQYRSFSDLK